MATFTGTDGNDFITPAGVSPGVISDGPPAPDAAADEIDGGAGNDTIDGGGGDRDIVDGGEGNDSITSSEGTLAFGGEGNDTMVGAFNDVLIGGDGDDAFVAGDSTRAFGEAGDDTFVIPTEVNGAQLSGGDGADTFQASAGNIELHGDAGNDLIVWTMTTPQTSDSLIDGGDDADIFKVVSIQDDHATTIELSNDEGFDDIHIERDFPWPTDQNTDANLFAQNVEHIEIVSGRGADTIVVQDQTGLGVQQLDIDLGGAAAGGPDGQHDVASIEGTSDGDHASVSTVAGGIVVSGLAATVKVTDIDHSAAAGDQVEVATGSGDDTIDLSRGSDGGQLGALVVDGGDGLDAAAIGGSTAGEAYIVSQAGDGASVSQGGVTLGQLVNVETINIATGGGGDSVVINDLTGAGVQRVNVDLSGATAGQPDGVADRVTFEDLGAGDQIFVTQSADGRSVQAGEGQVAISVTGLDNQDQVIFHGNAGDDTLVASGAASQAQITLNGNAGDDLVIGGNGAENLFGEAGNDTLQGGSGRNVLDGGDGDDVILNADGSIGVGGAGNDTITGTINDVIQAGDGDDLIRLGSSTQATGGSGADTFTAAAGAANGSSSDGGDGDDVFRGAGGNLVFHGGAGDDTMRWDMGANISSNTLLEGGTGTDSLAITGPQDAKSWSITVGNNGTGFELVQESHAGLTAKLFTQNTETVSFGGGQGADTIVVNDQTGLGVQALNIDLGASAAGGPDGQHDSLTLNGTSAADHVVVSTVDGRLTVAGASPVVETVENLDHGGSVSDSVLIATGVGDDVVKMFALNDATLNGVVTVDTGAGDDTVIGGNTGFTLLFHGGDQSHDQFLFFHGAASGGADHIELLGGPDHSFADLLANQHITQVGADVVVTDGGGTFLTLTNTDIGSLSASDFLFG